MVMNSKYFTLKASKNNSNVLPIVELYTPDDTLLGKMYITKGKPLNITSLRFASLEKPVSSSFLNSLLSWASSNWEKLKKAYSEMENKEISFLIN